MQSRLLTVNTMISLIEIFHLSSIIDDLFVIITDVLHTYRWGFIKKSHILSFCAKLQYLVVAPSSKSHD